MKQLIFIFITVGSLFGASSAYGKPKKPKTPKHIVLIIGDGTGLAQWSAYNAKRTQGINSMDSAAVVFTDFPVIGFSLTSSADAFITDSGAGATALATGKKANNYMIGMAADSSKPITISEIAHLQGKSTGIAVTCELTHATPASFFAHQPSRKLMNEIGADFITGMSPHDLADLQERNGQTDVGSQFVKKGSIDVALGGGRNYFDTNALKNNGYAIGTGYEAMKQLQNQSRRVVFYDDQPFPPKAHEGRNKEGMYLADASESVLKTMFLNPKGSFTMIEGSQVDWAGHENDSIYLMAEMEDFDVAIRRVVTMAKADKNTLVIVTADHETGGLSLTDWDKARSQPAMHFSTGHHTGIPVPVFAYGPGAELFSGAYQNTAIFTKIQDLLTQPIEKK
ncbi:MAG: alkaline phosphatase [Bacteroidetes bacterium]|nr:alkaline phosphatase [Bacteroidota bacterium]MDA1224524.1 alkaline phosphatase [Bacteroidota bacterium]